MFCRSIVPALIAAVASTGALADDRLLSLAGSEWGFAEGRDTTIQFREKDVAGFAGCNRFRGTYTYADGKLALGPLATTRMACPPEQMETERKVLQVLDAAKAADATHKTLTLKNASGEPLATLARRDWD